MVRPRDCSLSRSAACAIATTRILAGRNIGRAGDFWLRVSVAGVVNDQTREAAAGRSRSKWRRDACFAWIRSGSVVLSRVWSASDRFLAAARLDWSFVVLPLAIFGRGFRCSPRDFGFQSPGLRELFKSHLPLVLVVVGSILIFQYFLGGSAAPLREGKFSTTELLVGLPLCLAWLIIETGLVEEFFFRALLQTRLSAWFRSEVTGVVLMALIFGLAHAPGFIFRHAGVVEELGANPSALDALAYSIVTLSVGGIFFGVV